MRINLSSPPRKSIIYQWLSKHLITVGQRINFRLPCLTVFWPSTFILFTRMLTLFSNTALHIEVTDTDIVLVNTTTDHAGQREAIEMDGVVTKMMTMTLGLAEAGKSQGF